MTLTYMATSTTLEGQIDESSECARTNPSVDRNCRIWYAKNLQKDACELLQTRLLLVKDTNVPALPYLRKIHHGQQVF